MRNRVLRRARKRSVLPCLGGPAGCCFEPDQCYSGPGSGTSTTWDLESKSERVHPSVMSDSLRPHGRYIGSSVHEILHTGVGCHSLHSAALPVSGIELGSPVLQAESLPSEPAGKPWSFLEMQIIRLHLCSTEWSSGGHGVTSLQVVLMGMQAWEALDENEVKKHRCRCGWWGTAGWALPSVSQIEEESALEHLGLGRGTADGKRAHEWVGYMNMHAMRRLSLFFWTKDGGRVGREMQFSSWSSGPGSILRKFCYLLKVHWHGPLTPKDGLLQPQVDSHSLTQ